MINENHSVDSIVNSEVKQYISAFSKGEKTLKSSLEEATYVDNLDGLSKYMDTVQKDYIKRQKASNKSLLKNLRYPNIS